MALLAQSGNVGEFWLFDLDLFETNRASPRHNFRFGTAGLFKKSDLPSDSCIAAHTFGYAFKSWSLI
jgi:hypothetical protein